jgi:hypothetical protein
MYCPKAPQSGHGGRGFFKSRVLTSQTMMEYPAESSNSQFSRPTLGMRIRGKEGYIETGSHSRPIRHHQLPATVSGCQRSGLVILNGINRLMINCRAQSMHKYPRTRERCLALYMIASGQSNATLWAKRTNRCDESIMKWVHRYNEVGPDSLIYRRTGGSTPFLRPNNPNR